MRRDVSQARFRLDRLDRMRERRRKVAKQIADDRNRIDPIRRILRPLCIGRDYGQVVRRRNSRESIGILTLGDVIACPLRRDRSSLAGAVESVVLHNINGRQQEKDDRHVSGDTQQSLLPARHRFLGLSGRGGGSGNGFVVGHDIIIAVAVAIVFCFLFPVFFHIRPTPAPRGQRLWPGGRSTMRPTQPPTAASAAPAWTASPCSARPYASRGRLCTSPHRPRVASRRGPDLRPPKSARSPSASSSPPLRATASIG